jgi:hypothetical protein
VGKLLSMRGWGVLILIAILIVAAELLRAFKLAPKLLYTAVALVAVSAAVGEWKR